MGVLGITEKVAEGPGEDHLNELYGDGIEFYKQLTISGVTINGRFFNKNFKAGAHDKNRLDAILAKKLFEEINNIIE